MAWQNPKTDWKAGDVPAATDFNRIEGNVQELQNTKETPAGAQAKAEAAAGAVQAELDAHQAEKVHQEEIHGLRVNKATGEFEYFDGEEWKEISVDALQIRDNPELNLRFKVSDTAPAAVDGRVYYNTEDKLF